MRHAYGDAHIHSDGDSNANAYAITDSYGDGHIHSDGDSNGNAYAKPDGNSHIYAYGDCNGNAYAITDGNCDCDRTAAAYTNAAASADTAASPLTVFGIRGTRENELASSHPPEDELRLMNSLLGKPTDFPYSFSPPGVPTA